MRHFPSKARYVLPSGFAAPDALPSAPDDRRAWQERNQSWWQQNTMSYEWDGAIPFPEFSAEYFAEIDRRFFAATRPFMPWTRMPFEALLDRSTLAQQDVLEIGCGNGSHAQLIAGLAKSYTGIDLTARAAEATTKRLAVANLRGVVQQMDAEQMSFADATFDHVWSWGVVHHSADTPRIIGEMHRVLRPRGTATMMVYYRGWFAYYVTGALRTLLRRKLPTPARIHETIQLVSDGAIARYYTPRTWRALVGDRFTIDEIRLYGQKAELLPLPGGRVKSALLGLLPDALTRAMTNRLAMGRFIVFKMTRA